MRHLLDDTRSGRTVVAALALTLVALAAPARAAEIPVAGMAAEEERDWVKAELIYREALAEEPDSVELWLRLAGMLHEAGKIRPAAEANAKAADLRPEDDVLQRRAAAAWAEADEPKQALVYVQRILARDPEDADAHERRAALAGWTADYKTAEASTRWLLARRPGDPKLQVQLGQLLAWQGRVDEAVKVLDPLARSGKADADTLSQLASVESMRGHFDRATELYDQALAAAINGNADEIAARKAISLAWGGRPREALAEMQGRDPGRSEVRLARSVALFRIGDLGKARTSLGVLDTPELKDMGRILDRSRSSAVTPDVFASSDSDTVETRRIGLAATTPLGVAGMVSAYFGTERLSASPESAFHAPEGDDQSREIGWAQFAAPVGSSHRVSVRAGLSKTRGRDADLIGTAEWSYRPLDALSLDAGFSRDAYAVSPLALSEAIVLDDFLLDGVWQPDSQWTTAVSVRYGFLSDQNRRWTVALAPRRTVWRDREWSVTAGAWMSWAGFDERRAHGYYDPSLFQQYLAQVLLERRFRGESRLSLDGHFGAGRDDTMSGFKRNSSLQAAADLVLARRWSLTGQAAWANNGLNFGDGYEVWSGGIALNFTP